jgi:hypothetical protein
MRHLTAVGAAAVLLAAGIGAAAAAGADPSDAPSPPPTSAAPAPASSAAPATSTSAAPETPATSTSAAPETPATSTSAIPAGAHQVTYRVTTTSDLTANIYYVIGDPPDQAAANKPEFMPMARTQVGPGAPWSFQATLNDPTQWAFVSASGGLRVNPEFRCEIAVDGQVVVSQQGGSGVQCALRPW